MYKKTSTSVLMAFMINGNKMRLEMKNRSQRYYINRPRPKHGPKHTKYKMCPSIIMAIVLSKS